MARNRFEWWGALLGAVCLTSCQGDGDSGEPAFEITTDQASYVAVASRPPGDPHRSWQFRMITTLRNTGNGFLVFRNYYRRPLVAVFPADPTQYNGYVRAVDLLGQTPLILPPGHSYTDTTFISGPTGFPQGEPVDERGLEGEFRVIYALNGCDYNPECETRWGHLWPRITVTRQRD